MRPPRVVIVVAFFLTTVFLTSLSLRSSHKSHRIRTASPASQTAIQSFFSFRVPFSLFPPNAIITLTHENSTAFLARPAAFGPSLPADGLKGQVWIGNGFGDDSMRQGTIGTSAEGELGCSDVPGWVESYAKSRAETQEVKDGDKVTAGAASIQRRSNPRGGRFQRSAERGDTLHGTTDTSNPTADDGTDDYLHHPLPESFVTKPTDKDGADSNKNHADIQSLQEGAEIAGKIVLLSRGGCGFLEKVKWAQRRGGIAVIVGDDIKGGSLFQMYARGDTSNVTIPSVFTSRTTAHLLSSLVGAEGFIANSIDENGNQILKAQRTKKAKKAGKKHSSNPTFTPATALPRPTTPARAAAKASTKKGSTATINKSDAMTTQRPGWFKSLFGFGNGKSKSESSRPPSSGRLDWVLVDDWKDDEKLSQPKTSVSKPDAKVGADKVAAQKNRVGDDFVIGVQDWRDPDLVGVLGSDNDAKAQGAKGGIKSDATKTRSSSGPASTTKKHIGGALQDIPEYIPPLRGGSITPGSGEYGEKDDSDKTVDKGSQQDGSASKEKSKGLLNAIFGDDEEEFEFSMESYSKVKNIYSQTSEEGEDDDEDEYDGLWVTLTPTSGAAPFLDTLLVLVVSPLVTLTVVYALLLVRSRIRRRRWRAPKSVVERLPVRTYQTVVTPGSQSPRSPTSTSSSVTTPLLQHSPLTTSSRPRPRSRTTTGIPEPGDLLHANSAPLQVPVIPPRTQELEKNASISSEWKKYMGKQIECVVCLEEYVDGVSRVMSLPCGHEFHADCITPWLITRRRTCPICKGDVVRSLAQGSSANPQYETYHDDSDEDVQIQAAESVNNSSSAALPIPHSSSNEDEGDLEQGMRPLISPRPRRPNPTGSWRTILASSLGASSRSPHRQQQQQDRDR